MEFKEWTPPSLIDAYSRQKNESIHRDYLTRLCTHSDMEALWKRLYSQRRVRPCDNDNSKDLGNSLMAFSLFNEIKGAFWLTTATKHSTRQDDIREYQTLAKAARELANSLHYSVLNDPVYRWYPVEAINTIIEKDINLEKFTGCFSLINDENELNRKGVVYQEVKIDNRESVYWKVAENTKDFFVKYCITPQYPFLSQILQSLATDADDLAKKAGKEPRLIERSSSPATIFIRKLYVDFWREEFGSPLYRTFATLCRVVLDDPTIDSDTVKDALKGLKL
jgi:hypothetical protein